MSQFLTNCIYYKEIIIIFYLFFDKTIFTEPVAEISGAPEIFVSHGSNIFLTCIVKYSPEPPAFIRWYHNDRVSILRVL